MERPPGIRTGFEDGMILERERIVFFEGKGKRVHTEGTEAGAQRIQ
jgi:hypothetical protein